MLKKKWKIPSIEKTVITEEMVFSRNCENFVGSIQVPLGIAGPIKIFFQECPAKNYFLPISTTEGALVASINRGCKATFLSGGIKTYIENIGATRGPLFKVKSIGEARVLVDFVKNNFALLAKEASTDSHFLKLLKEDHLIVGKNVWFRFYFETAEAMGMNMATNASDKIVKFIEKATGSKCLSLSGNFCQDKKPSFAGFLLGRGKKVWAEAVVKKVVVEKVLKTSSDKIVEIVRKKSHLGSIVSGSLGYNAHFANIIAALFLATGQDMAHVAEGAMGITEAETEKNGDLYFSVYLPDLMVGTVGGGTGLPTQKEALAILELGEKKTGDSLKLAQIIGAGVLAGELSLSAALAAGHLAGAHAGLGRGKK